MKKIPLLVIAGPTASGKTALAVELAKLYNGEVVSADSMQIYKGMDIATAKPTIAEQDGVPHHLISFVNQDEPFSVADYLKHAKAVIEDIHNRGKLPIVAGGTGLYISSLIDNIKFDSVSDNDGTVRERLYKEAEASGNEAMLARLAEVDSETAKILHPNNLGRTIRALEVFETTGIPLSEHKRLSRLEETPYNFCIIGLNYQDRQKLYDRINLRVDTMLDAGLLQEAEDIYKNAKLKTAHQAIGYKELIPYFEENAELSDCIDKIKQETRHYAKRQLTWFRKDSRIQWIFLDECYNNAIIIEKSQKIIAISGIL